MRAPTKVTATVLAALFMFRAPLLPADPPGDADMLRALHERRKARNGKSLRGAFTYGLQGRNRTRLLLQGARGCAGCWLSGNRLSCCRERK